MKKKMMALLLGICIFTTFVPMSYAEEGELTTATQTDAREKAKDVDEDIREEVEAQIPEEYEEINISNADELIELAVNCRLDIWSVNKKVVLTDDISLVGKEFKGIPTFGGIFDGQGHSISELSLDTEVSYTGLFNRIQKTGVIKNLSVSGTVSPSGNQVFVSGIAGENNGCITDCNFKGVVAGTDYVGCIAGINQLSGTINNCQSDGYVRGLHFVGGICGENMGNITYSTNNALVNTTNKDKKITPDVMNSLSKVLSIIKTGSSDNDKPNQDVTTSDEGGIAGVSIGVISRCINNGNVGYEHVGYNVGGIVGRQSGYVLSCSNNGSILGRKDVGGIVGQAEPYITVDLSSDIAYQLSEAIGKLHDIVTVTLSDAKNQSGVITNRLAAIQKFTAGAIEDVRYIAGGTVDYANGVSSAATQAFSRVEYVLDESSKNGGVLDQTTEAAKNAKKATGDLKNAIADVDLEKYLTDAEKEEYEKAKLILESASAQYNENYDKSYRAYYNSAIAKAKTLPKFADLVYVLESGTEADLSKWNDTDKVKGDLESSKPDNLVGSAQKGNWKHKKPDGSYEAFPQDNDDELNLDSEAKVYAEGMAQEYVNEKYVSPLEEGNSMETDLRYATAVITELTTRHMDEMTDATRADAQKGMNNLEKASDNLSKAGNQTKTIISNLAGMDAISFPQFSAEYKAHTTSLADNMQGMNDNFGLLSSEVNNANNVIIDDLQAMSDQFNTIMLLYTDAIDGVLEADYTKVFEDVSLEEAEKCMDATIDGCLNYGSVAGDIDSSGIAGTMAIEYDFDLESDITGIKDAKLNTSYITKCVLRGNRNYGEISGVKNYSGGICGLQEMGTIIKNYNYSNVSSASGEYVGGICGSSLSYVVDSCSRGILKGKTYVGGIVGEGMHVRNCYSLVDIKEAESWFGAIAGHEKENGEVRNNFFISDELSGIDRISYAKKAEPCDITQAPKDFDSLTVTFELEDNGTRQKVGKIHPSYGEALAEGDYPSVPEKEGYYVTWDMENVEQVKTDMIITAVYNRFRTTLSEADVREGLHQSEFLVDGEFKEWDNLVVDRHRNYSFDNLSMDIQPTEDLKEYERLTVTIPDDGKAEHQVRFRPEKWLTEVFKDYELYLVNADGTAKQIEKTGTMGGYSTYNIKGNNLELIVKFTKPVFALYKVVLIVATVALAVIILLIINIILMARHGKKIPRIFSALASKFSKTIESKEQLFYDDSKDEIAQKEEEKQERKEKREARRKNIKNLKEKNKTKK